ncbi:MAG: trypsin-like peptidase domain-containing protein [Desulfobacterales bacterium]|nr:trypsin-like peptidase domain-containing protein [Desulfobacterales bacterium]
MRALKEFVTNYLTGLLAFLLVLNIIIVLFGVMGIGLQELLQVPTYLMNVLQDPEHYLNHTSSNSAPTGSNRPMRNVAGLVSSPNIQLVCSDDSFASAASKVRPAVVNISCESIERSSQLSSSLEFDDPSQDLLNFGGIGSGIIVDPRGYILTCYHIVSKASNIYVTPFGSDIKRYKARIIASDASLNLAMLKINISDTMTAATIGDSAQMEVADMVLAIGSPFGLEQTVTHGIISDNKRDLQINGNIYREMMQTDVPINRGSSGGPLINISGEVIGINMAIYSTTGVYNGVSFAMPINQAKLLIAKTIQ